MLPHCGGVFVEGLESGELPEVLEKEGVLLGSEVSDYKVKVKKEKNGVKNEVKEEKTDESEKKQEEEMKDVKNICVKDESKEITGENGKSVLNGDVRLEEKMDTSNSTEIKCDIKTEDSGTRANSVEKLENLNKKEDSQKISGKISGKSLTPNHVDKNMLSLLKNEEIAKLKNCVKNVPESILNSSLLKSESALNGSICEDAKMALNLTAKDKSEVLEKLDSEMLTKNAINKDSMHLVNGTMDHSAFKVPQTHSPQSKLDGSYSELISDLSNKCDSRKKLENLSSTPNAVFNNGLNLSKHDRIISSAEDQLHKESTFRSIDSMIAKTTGKGLNFQIYVELFFSESKILDWAR